MDVANYFMEKKVTSWLVTLLLLIGGGIAFTELGRLEDPEFDIKQVNILTQYPGASPTQVEQEVTFAIEQELQNLPYVKKIWSQSKAGYSLVQVEMKDSVRGEQLTQVWDEVRKKVSDTARNFPPGTKQPQVLDDFGDVFGVLLALSGQGYDLRDLEQVGDRLQRELSLVPGVAKVTLVGTQIDQVFIEISQSRLSSLGMPVQQIAALLSEQNVVANAGHVHVGSEYIRFRPTGEFHSVAELGNLTVISPTTGESILLRDIADIRRGFREPSHHLLGYNTHPALNLGISFASGVNVVKVGNDIEEKLKRLEHSMPVGMELSAIYYQSNEVEKAVNDFLFSLLLAVVIVVVVLLVFMGLKSGLLIGLILTLTIFGTFIVMEITGIALQRVSLGGLIIALGMLVDNAIVITEGILIGLKKGLSKRQAANAVVKQTQWPLLGATVIAITAFAPIGLSPDAIGEFVGSLFWVLLISLLISWFTAISLTPFFGELFFKAEGQSGDGSDPYQGWLYTAYRFSLSIAIKHRALTVFALIGLFAGSAFGFTLVKQAFFPSSATPMFFVELRYPEGSAIQFTQAKMSEVESFVADQDEVAFVASSVNQGFPRFILTYSAVEAGANNGQLIIRTHQRDDIDTLMTKLDRFLVQQQPSTEFMLRRLALGPNSGAAIEARFSGPDPEQLRQLSEQVKTIYRQDDQLTAIRDDWKQRVKVYRPQFDDLKASELGISKQDFDRALLTHYSGDQVGVYRDGDKLLPIVITVPETERQSVSQVRDIQVYASTTGRYVSLSELVTGFETEWEDPVIQRRNRSRTITVMAEPNIHSPDNANTIFNRIRGQVESLPLPPGYQLEWGGEYQNSKDAQENVFASVPLGYLFMFVITILLFNSIKESLVVWLCVPLALIGVVSGLLLLDVPFGFMGFLGFLSLSGMIVKNGIVLIDQINTELAAGKPTFDAVFDSAVSRVRPVLMAAITTILGLVPLLSDPFFIDMAVVISFGLGFATLLTLIAVPVFYLMFHGEEGVSSGNRNNPSLQNALS